MTGAGWGYPEPRLTAGGDDARPGFRDCALMVGEMERETGPDQRVSEIRRARMIRSGSVGWVNQAA
jgi:hypothetical protein